MHKDVGGGGRKGTRERTSFSDSREKEAHDPERKEPRVKKKKKIVHFFLGEGGREGEKIKEELEQTSN